MRLTNFFDYTLRLLMYAATHSNRLITVEETAGVYGISRTHLMKVANQLTREGYLKAVRGRSAGLSLPNGRTGSSSAMSCARPSRISRLWNASQTTTIVRSRRVVACEGR
jgi:predicted transcriptional regulator of viral defense system